jgi:hypothetical protein
MNYVKKWAVMVQLRRSNPVLPPRAKVGIAAQRKLDTAFAIAEVAYAGGQDPRTWAAKQILDRSRHDDPLYAHLARRLARAIWHEEQPDELAAECWFHLYTISDTNSVNGYSPQNWEYVYPDDQMTATITLDSLSPFRRELLRIASEIDGSFLVHRWAMNQGAGKGDKYYYDLNPIPCLTGRAIRMINRVARLNLPIPRYRGRKYEDDPWLFYLAILRLFLLRGRRDWAIRVARHIAHLGGRIDHRVTIGVDPQLVVELTRAVAS